MGGRRGGWLDGFDDRRRPTPDRPAVEGGRSPVVPGGDGDPQTSQEAADGEVALDPDQLELFERG